MTNGFHPLTHSEIRAFEIKAHQLRAETMRNGSKAVTAYVKSLAHRVADALARPAHT